MKQRKDKGKANPTKKETHGQLFQVDSKTDTIKMEDGSKADHHSQNQSNAGESMPADLAAHLGYYEPNSRESGDPAEEYGEEEATLPRTSVPSTAQDKKTEQ
jgi:hypothetical protein